MKGTCHFFQPLNAGCVTNSYLSGPPRLHLRSHSLRSERLTKALEGLAYWRGGRNHMLFEFSDAPCMPFLARHAIVAKVCGCVRMHACVCLRMCVRLCHLGRYSRFIYPLGRVQINNALM